MTRKLSLIGLSAAALMCLGAVKEAQAQTYVNDPLIGTAGADLTTHTPGTGGAWSLNPNFSANHIIFDSTGSRVRGSGTGTNSSIYYNSATPPAADGYVQADLTAVATPGAADIAGVTFRESSTADTFYTFVYQAGSTKWIIFKHVAGSASAIGTSTTATLTVGTVYTARLTGSGSTLTGSVTSGGTTTTVATATDSSITAAGFAGVFEQAATVSDTSGIHMANFVASATSASTLVGVASSAWHFSPANWAGDTGRGGSVYRQTPYNGAYAQVYWTASASPTATLDVSNQTTGSFISYVLNGVLHDNIAVPASGGIALSGITPSALNTLTVYTRNSAQSARWNETNAYKITDLAIDPGSTAGTAPAWNGKWVLIRGTSITEGINADANALPNNLTAYSHLLGEGLLQQGYDYSIIGNGSLGWIHAGDTGGDVPGYYPVSGGAYTGSGSWNMIDGTTSLLDSNGHISAYGQTGQEPALISLEFLTNEVLNSISVSDTQASVTQGLAATRGTAPNAQIIPIIGFNLYATGITGYSGSAPYIAAMKTGVSSYQSAHLADIHTYLADFGSTLANQLYSISTAVHPPAAGHAIIAPDVAGVVFPKLLSTTGTLTIATRQPSRSR